MSAARPPWREQARAVARWEWVLLRDWPQLRWAVVGLVFVPAVYALLSLSSAWDPAAHSRSLPVGLVNGDLGASYRERELNLGAQLLDALEQGAQFDYRRYADAEAARADVRRGRLDFLLIVPPDFSRQAVPGEAPGAAKLIVHTSEGNDYFAAAFARRFAPEVTARVNAMLNEARWSLVLDSAAGSQKSLQALRASLAELGSGSAELQAGLARARDGAQSLARASARAEPAIDRLEAGSRTAADTAAQLAGGLRQLNGSLRALESRRPADADVQALRAGARSLADAHRELGRNLETAQGGAVRLEEGLSALKEAADEIPLVGGRLAEGAGQLRAGAGQLAEGLGTLREGQSRMAAGASRLDEGVHTMTEGVLRSGAVLSGLVGRLPEEARLEQFVAGLRELAGGTQGLQAGLQPLDTGLQGLQAGLLRLEEGGQRLGSGLQLVLQALPGEVNAPGGSAPGMAASVQPQLEVEAPVANQGLALAVNFVPLSLWVGAVTAAFLFHLRRLSEPTAGFARSAQVAGKLALPAAVVLLQALGMVLLLRLGFGVELARPWAFTAVLASASLCFLSVVFLLVRLLGDLGKVVAVLLLIVQIGAAGALLPIQLSAPLFQTLHPLLPFTWVVKSFRAALFGAFEGQWLAPLGVVLGIAGGALLLATVAGRWRVLPAAQWRPALDLD